MSTACIAWRLKPRRSPDPAANKAKACPCSPLERQPLGRADDRPRLAVGKWRATPDCDRREPRSRHALLLASDGAAEEGSS